MENRFRITSAAVTDRGLSEKRPQNEDSYLEMPRSGIYAVADGVGGAQAGEVASQMAMELVAEAFTNLTEGQDPESVMRTAFGRANSAIHQMAHELPQLASMATTVVALHLSDSIATIGHVGDSRLYRVDREGNLFRETEDHSMVADEVRAGRMTEEQAENHPSRNIISRALGADSIVEPDLRTIMVEAGTAFLLCSDGITRHVTDAEIKGVLTFGGEPADVCQYLRDLCYERGAEDNLTAVIIRIAANAGVEVAPTTDRIIDLREEDTVATARSPFESIVSDDDDYLLEIDTQELPPARSLTAGVDNSIEFEPNLLDVAVASSSFSGPSEDILTEAAIETPPTAPAEESQRSEPAAANDFSMFGNSGTAGPESAEPSSSRSFLTSLVMLALGAIIGLGVYHFVLAPKPAETSVPQLSEMSSPNIPLNTFEKNRRNVDSDPAGYITKAPVDPQDCEDAYLLGRAYLLTGDYPKAKLAFAEARKRLADADPVNAKTLAVEIATGIAITNDTTVQSIFKNELDSSQKSQTNTNSSSSR